MLVRRALFAVLITGVMAAATAVPVHAVEEPNQLATVEFGDGAQIRFPAEPTVAAALTVSVAEEPMGNEAGALASDTALLVPVSDEVVIATAIDAAGASVNEFPHKVRTVIGTNDVPAHVSEFQPGVEVRIPLNAEQTSSYAAHNVAIYSRASSTDTWKAIPSVYDRAGSGEVIGHSDELGQFAVFASAEAAAIGDGPTVVLDPDDDQAFANWGTPDAPNIVRELDKNLELAAGVKVELETKCEANVVITRSDPTEPFVSRALRATTAANANPDLTMTLAFNSFTPEGGTPGEPWGSSNPESGGPRVWAAAGSTGFGYQFLEDVNDYTGRFAPNGINQPSPFLPYSDFVGSLSSPYAHVEALFLDNFYDRPVVETDFDLIVDWIAAAIIEQLESQGDSCDGQAPETPPQERLDRLRDLGYQNYLAYGADPVSFSNGNFITDEYLFALTGLGDQVIDLTLTYNSLDTRDSVFGVGWSYAYGSLIQLDSSGSAQVRMGDGSTFYFPGDGSTWTEPPGANIELEKVGSQLRLTLNSSTEIFFDEREQATWLMSKVIDRQRNEMTFSWGGRKGGVYPLQSITDQAGQQVVLSSDAQGQISTITHPDGRVWALRYADRRLESITDPRNVTRRFTYDGSGRLAKIIDGDDMAFVSNVYDGAGRVISQQDGEGNVRTIAYQTDRTVYTDARGNDTTYVFNELGQVTETIDATGGSAATDFDDDYNPILQADARGEAWLTSYDDDGRPTKRTDPLGNITEYEYNSFGDLIKLEQPDGLGGVRTTEFVVNDVGRIERTIYDDGSFERSEFDEHGDQTHHWDANGNLTQYKFDSRGNVIETIDASGDVATATYTLSNKVETLTDGRGSTVTYGYDAADNQTQVIDAVGAVWGYTYGSSNQLLTETDPLGRVTSYGYDENLNLVRVDLPDGTSEQYKLDAEYNIVEVTDRRGGKSATQFDQLNRPWLFTDQVGAEWTTKYDEVGNPTEMVDPDGDTIKLEYDALGRVVKRTDPRQFVWTSIYDAAGNIVAQESPDGTRTESRYDELGRLRMVIDEEGEALEFDYDAFGNPISQKDRRGNVIITEYDELNRTSKIVNPDGGIQRMTYDAAGNLETSIDPINGTVLARYDARNRAVGSTDQLGATTSTEYDLAGNPIRHVDAEGHTWVLEYDAMNRVEVRRSPLGDIERYRYDGNGNVTERTMPDGRVDRLVYNGRDELIEVIENYNAAVPAGVDVNVSTKYKIQPDGDIEQITNPNGAVTTHGLDEFGRIIKITDPIGRIEINVFDSVGNLQSNTDGNGNTTTYDYFPDRQLKSISYADGTSVAYTYDADNFQDSMVDSLGTTTWQRDWRGNETSSNDANGRVVQHGYDLVGNVTSITYADGFVSDRTFDAASRMETLRDRSGVIDFDRDRLGRATTVSHPNDIVTSMVYDPEGKVTTINHQEITQRGSKPRVKERARFDYVYTADDLVERREIRLGGRKSEFDDYSYDGLDRLIDSSTDASFHKSRTAEYSYDAASNRTWMRTSDDPTTKTSRDRVEVSYRYDAADQLLVEHRDGKYRDYLIRRDYDGNGNLITESTEKLGYSRKHPRRTSVETFTYNLADDLTSDGGNRWKRDGMGRAMAWADSNYSHGRYGTEVLDGEVLTGDGPDLGGEISGDLSSKHRRSDEFVDQVYDGLFLIAQVGDRTGESYFRDADMGLLSQSANRSNDVLLHDLLGTVYATANKHGSVYTSDRFSDFGNRFGASRHGSVFGFHGEFQDEDSDRLHFYARSYNPTTSRFFQQDRVDGALTSPMTQHDYLYGFANPVTYSDFLGYVGFPKVSISLPNPLDAVKSVAGKVVDGAAAAGKAAWTHRHEILDVAGMVPVIGEVADAANAVLYLAEGDHANAMISLAALVPVGGQAATGARLGYKGVGAVSDIVKYSDEVAEAGSNVVKRTRSASNAADTASSARTATRTTSNAAGSGSRAASDTASTVASKTDELAASSARASSDKVDNVVASSTPAAKPAANASAAPSKPVAAPQSKPAGRATTSPGNGPVDYLAGSADEVVDTSRAGVTRIGSDGQSVRVGRRAQVLPGEHNVVIHGKKEGLTNFSPSRLAEIVNSKAPAGCTIRLISCHGGINGVGQTLADATGRPVWAATARVGTPRYGPPYPLLVDSGGKWVHFRPGG